MKRQIITIVLSVLSAIIIGHITGTLYGEYSVLWGAVLGFVCCGLWDLRR